MPNKTTIEVRGPHDRVLSTLLSVEHAVDIRPQVDRVALVEIGLGFVTAFWVESDRRTVLIVHDPDHRDTVASQVFARLAEGAGRFEIRHGRRSDEDFRYQLDYAS